MTKMPRDADTIVVFTGKGPNTILHEGGSASWKLNPRRARGCKYLICTRNRPHDPSHGSAFLVGMISELTPEGDRWIIRFSEYAVIDMPRVWDGGHNPVRYVRLSDLGIDLANLVFQPVKPGELNVLTSEQVKQLRQQPQDILSVVAAYFGVNVRSVEITIKG
jgi:hypothetical protein